MQNLALGILAGLGLAFAFRWWMMARARRAEGLATPELPGPVAEKLQARGRVLLYFFSPQCGPCRAMTPVVERLAADHDNVFKIDVSREFDLARRLQVMATPTTLLVGRERVEKVVLGAASEQALRALL